MRKVHRVCEACGVDQPRSYSPDPCLGTLPGVHAACCGHGNLRACYVIVKGRKTALRGQAAWDRLMKLGGHPAPLTHNDPRRGLMPGWKEVAP